MATVRFKTIKPTPLKTKQFNKIMMGGIRETIGFAYDEFGKTYATWSEASKPHFTRYFRYEGNTIWGRTQTDSKIYRYVNDGTDPHRIPKEGTTALLVFPWAGKGSYRPKTRPRVIGSTAGGPTGPLVAFPHVQHPGTDPRHFDEEVEKTTKPKFITNMNRAMSEARRASGHAI
jgi:hypothetical protein